MEIKGMPLEELKGIGEKTGKLFRKMGIGTVDELLRFYPRDYDAFQDPLPIGQLKEQAVNAVEGVLMKPADLLRLNGMELVTAKLKDLTGSLQLTWFRMPYIRSQLKAGTPYVFRGRVVRRQGRLLMEQPQIYSPAAELVIDFVFGAENFPVSYFALILGNMILKVFLVVSIEGVSSMPSYALIIFPIPVP